LIYIYHDTPQLTVNLLFSQHLYVRKGPSVSDEFLLEEHFEREMQLKKFTTRRKLCFFFPRTLLSRWHTARESGHSVCELLTTRSCIRCTRCIHTYTHRAISSHTAPTSTRSFPTDETNAFSQLDVRIRLAHLQLHANLILDYLLERKKDTAS